MDVGILVEFTNPSSQSHEPAKVLDRHELHTCNHICCQVLVKWKDKIDKGSFWENISILRKRFLNFIFEDKNSSSRREECQDNDLDKLDGEWPRLWGHEVKGTRGAKCQSLE